MLRNDLGEAGQNAKPSVSGSSDAVFSLWQLAQLLSPAVLPTVNCKLSLPVKRENISSFSIVLS